MNAAKIVIYLASAVLLLSAGCATSPETASRQQAKEDMIDAILSVPLDPAQYGETQRCLAEREYRDFRALDDRHMLFEGLGGKLWINTLRTRCPDLRNGTIIRVRSTNWSRICEMDSFQAGDWFDWPWYRRMPWHWGGTWGTGMQCTFGEFQPVTKDQVAEIEAALKSR